MKFRKADTFNSILKRVRKEVNGFTVREIEIVPKVDNVTKDSIIEYGVYKDTEKISLYGTLTSTKIERKEIKLGFKTLDEAITYAESL